MKLSIKQHFIISIIFLMIWELIIFWFSSKNGTDSTDMSNQFVFLFSENGVAIDLNTISYFVRKTAHVCEYTILSFLAFYFVICFSKYKQFIFKITQVFMVALFSACLDEFHQFFVVGRTAQVKDVCIDMIGFLLFCLFHFFLNRNLWNIKSFIQRNIF